MKDYNSAGIEFLHMFGGRRLLIFVGIMLYLIAGASLFSFIPETIDWIQADARRTVPARVVSAAEEHTRGEHGSSDRQYCVTLEYEINGTAHRYIKYYKHVPSESPKLHIYCTKQGYWTVLETNAGSIIFLTGLAVIAAIGGTRVLIAAKQFKKKQTGESA